MKKIPLLLILMVPLMIAAAVFGIIFGVRLIGVNQVLTLKSYQLDDIESLPAAEKVTTYKVEKTQREFEKNKTVTLDGNVVATYKHENITFISYCDNWDVNGLIEICEELLLNKHGDEIKELDEVIIYDSLEDSYWEKYSTKEGYNYIPINLYGFIPSNSNCVMTEDKNSIYLYYGQGKYSIDELALYISYAYGKYFMNYYFNTSGTEEEILSSPYFKIRYQDNSNIRYTDKDYSSYSDYYNNLPWYIHEISAYDYVYLLGSPTTKQTYEFIDTLERLRMDHADKEDELDKYYSDIFRIRYFNEQPHININLPLPDQVDKLPELIMEKVNLTAPKYEEHMDEVENINLKIVKQSQYGEIFYVATWDKPWKSDDVKYTLVSYYEDDETFLGVKSITGSERARAVFGGAVVDTGTYSYTFYETDHFKEKGFLRFRIIVTFSDGTAIASPAVDWSFE